MKYIHRNQDRWHLNFGWLKTAHSFSFWEYFNPQKMWFWTLRVINDDIIQPGQWFWMHPHNNMEIVTLVFSGELEHEDSMQNSEVIKAWEIQAMSAGSGILHSEINPSHIQATSLFQIWIQTKTNDIAPQYNQKFFDAQDRLNKLQLLVSPNQEDNVGFINQDAYFSRINLQKDKTIEYKKYIPNNGIYIINISGSSQILWENLDQKDAIWIENEDNIEIQSLSDDADILILEIPMQ